MSPSRRMATSTRPPTRSGWIKSRLSRGKRTLTRKPGPVPGFRISGGAEDGASCHTGVQSLHTSGRCKMKVVLATLLLGGVAFAQSADNNTDSVAAVAKKSRETKAATAKKVYTDDDM